MPNASVILAPNATRFAPVMTVARAELRRVRSPVTLVEVDATASLSSCCGHSGDREPGEDCGCRDCDVELVFTVASIVRGGPSRTVTISGECTLAPDERGGAPKFGAKDWSWGPDLVEAVEALIGDDNRKLYDIESAIESAI
jgi:hypothetical protein